MYSESIIYLPSSLRFLRKKAEKTGATLSPGITAVSLSAIVTSKKANCNMNSLKANIFWRNRQKKKAPPAGEAGAGLCVSWDWGRQYPAETAGVPNVGDDPQIVPSGTTPERPEKTYTPIPSACGAMWASPPTLKSVRDYRTYRLPLVPVPENTQNRPLGKTKRTVLRIPKCESRVDKHPCM